jgi:hypothetical protein
LIENDSHPPEADFATLNTAAEKKRKKRKKLTTDRHGFTRINYETGFHGFLKETSPRRHERHEERGVFRERKGVVVLFFSPSLQSQILLAGIVLTKQLIKD